MAVTDTYRNELRALITPDVKTVLEFGSGISTAVFAASCRVLAFEYDPPGDWHGATCAAVEWRWIKPERRPGVENLARVLFSEIANRVTGFRYARRTPGSLPLWDLAYIDGAVHTVGHGWCGGDLSYAARRMFAAVVRPYCRRVVIDDAALETYVMGRRCGRFSEL